MSKCWYCEKEIKSGDKVEIMHKDCFNKIADLEAKLAEKEKELKSLNYEKSIKHLSLNRDWANYESEEMQKHFNTHIFKDKFEVCCPSCGKIHEYEFKDIKYSGLFKNIYISCKSCPRSINELNFQQQAIAFYKTMYDLIGYEKHQDYLCYRNHISTLKHQDKILFAVEQLEKFRDVMEKLNENNSGYIIRFSSMRDREKFHEALDNQIEELKKGL